MEPKLYEIAYLLTPEATDEGGAARERFRKNIEERKGMVVEEGGKKKIQLSYPLRDKKEAWFTYIKFILKPEELPEFKERLREEKELLRYLLTEGEREERRKTPSPPKIVARKESVDITSIDKKLEEILGK